MKMEPTKWELSGLKDFADTPVEWQVGIHPVAIKRVTYVDEYAGEGTNQANTYNISIECVGGGSEGATANLKYFLKTKAGGDNRYAIGTLNSLWKAIYGPTENLGIPAPQDAEGCVVMADVEYKGNYVNVYHYTASSSDYAMYSDKMESQYFEDAE